MSTRDLAGHDDGNTPIAAKTVEDTLLQFLAISPLSRAALLDESCIEIFGVPLIMLCFPFLNSCQAKS